MELWPVIDPKSGIKVSQELRDTLVDFTVSCLIEDPIDVHCYGKDYFGELENLNSNSSPLEILTPLPKILDSDELIGSANNEEFVKIYEYVKIFERTKDFEKIYECVQVLEKSEEQTRKLQVAMKKCPLLRNLTELEIKAVISHMFSIEVKAGDVIIKQWDIGDFFFVIESGVYEVWLTEYPGEEQKHVFTYDNAGSFGELSLVHNKLREATIIAATDGLLWGMDRHSFGKILSKPTVAKRKRCEDFICNVPILQELTFYEQLIVADAFENKFYKAGEEIIKEGEDADGMYFMKDGVVTCSMAVNNEVFELGHLEYGKHFGELSLITEKPGEVTVKALRPCEVAFLDKDMFKRIMGPYLQLLLKDSDENRWHNEMAHIILDRLKEN